MRCSIHYVSISQKRHLCKWTHCPFHYNSNILFWCKASLPIITEDAIFVYLIGVAGNKRLACLCCVIIEGSPARLNHTWNYTLIGPIFPQNSLMTLVRFIDRGQDVVSKACYFIISPVIDIILTALQKYPQKKISKNSSQGIEHFHQFLCQSWSSFMFIEWKRWNLDISYK